MFRSALLFLACLALPALAHAQDFQQLVDQQVRVCDADPAAKGPPDFAALTCQSALFYEVDPQSRQIWVELMFEAEPQLLELGKPLGLFVSAKASSEAFLNGIAIGANGSPGTSELSEQPGNMDAVFFVPERTLRSGENRLVLRLSSMHSNITLVSPIHSIVLAPYRDPRQPGPATWFAVVTFGLFLAAFVVFGVSALRGKARPSSALIAAASLAAALQLAAEAARDVAPYPYPLHDLRLSLILLFAMAVGLSLCAYVLLILFETRRRERMLALGGVLSAMILIATLKLGFDTKTTFVLLAASLTASIAGLIAAMRSDRRGGWLAGLGLTLSALAYWLGGQFLDTWLYLLMAALLLWLLFKRARGDTDEVLSQPEAKAVQRIELTSSGKVEFVDAADIVRFSGAGDYVEVFLRGGRTSLCSGSLAGLEHELPAGFIRAHRSHIVNAALVKSLERESAGTGQLHMSDGSAVPVSRRNMSSVRAALTRK